MRPQVETNSGLSAVLRGVVADLQHASGADIVSIFLYEEATHTYYAPFATGQPQESLLDSLTDMREQLARYLNDAEQGKVPDELGVHQYGSTAWITVTRQRLIARDAPSEIDSTFIRRYQVQSTIGLPLLAGDRLLGLVYLNYRSREKAPDDSKLVELERRASAAAAVVQTVLAGAERTALEGLARLTGLLTAQVGDSSTNVKELRRLLSIALADLLMASNLDGAAIYQFGSQRTSLELVTAHLRVAAPVRIDRPDHSTPWEAALSATVSAATAEAELHPVATYALGHVHEPHGYLVLLSRDRLATVRRAPPTDMMLEAGANLIGGALASQRLIADLENSNRLLGALGDMTSAMLRPGSTRHEVIDSVVGHLTDSEVPEFDFNFATVYLLEEREDQAIVVKMAAGAATAAAIDAAETSRGSGLRATRARVPRWALEEDRVLARDDVLVHVARTWQPVIVGPLPDRQPQTLTLTGAPASEEGNRADVIAGSILVPATWTEVPIVRSDGTVLGHVLACLIGEQEHARAAEEPPFTLAGEVFERGGHKDLIRIFLPFGSDQTRRATGVLEVGYHRSYERRPDWGQVEALRAAAAQLAVAVEMARLYEEAQRHAEQVELVADVSKAIASSIDLDQTLRLVAQNMARLVNASLCQIALYEEDREGWYGAAASDLEEQWRRQHGERSEPSFLFDVLDRGEPVVIDDTAESGQVGQAYVKTFGVRSLMALPLVADDQPIGAAVLAERERRRAPSRTRAFTPSPRRSVTSRRISSSSASGSGARRGTSTC